MHFVVEVQCLGFETIKGFQFQDIRRSLFLAKTDVKLILRMYSQFKEGEGCSILICRYCLIRLVHCRPLCQTAVNLTTKICKIWIWKRNGINYNNHLISDKCSLIVFITRANQYY